MYNIGLGKSTTEILDVREEMKNNVFSNVNFLF